MNSWYTGRTPPDDFDRLRALVEVLPEWAGAPDRRPPGAVDELFTGPKEDKFSGTLDRGDAYGVLMCLLGTCRSIVGTCRRRSTRSVLRPAGR
ncbi:hypothetical protein ACIA8E_05225 [Streptomyces sp. NPDC051664]|uniref:hypothetical protein n=1 Tax=Streptomyces sp. NPDC051664 TaxID=3365668 RepID=UPI0037BB7701